MIQPTLQHNTYHRSKKSSKTQRYQNKSDNSIPSYCKQWAILKDITGAKGKYKATSLSE